MSSRSERFDPYVILAALERRRVSYVLIGGFARILQGTEETTQGLDLCPSLRVENVRRLAMRHGLVPAFVGLALGVIGAFAATRLAASMLYGITPRDPPTFVGVVTLLVLVAVGAAWLPARRATRVDPIVALRAE